MPKIPGFNENTRMQAGSPVSAVSSDAARLEGENLARFGKEVADFGVALFEKESKSAERTINAKLFAEQFDGMVKARRIQLEDDIGKMPPMEAKKLYESFNSEMTNLAKEYGKANLDDDLTYKKYLGIATASINVNNMGLSSTYKKHVLNDANRKLDTLISAQFSKLNETSTREQFDGTIAEVEKSIDELPDVMISATAKFDKKSKLKKDAMYAIAYNVMDKLTRGGDISTTHNNFLNIVDSYGKEVMPDDERKKLKDEVDTKLFNALGLEEKVIKSNQRINKEYKEQLENDNFNRLYAIASNRSASADERNKAMLEADSLVSKQMLSADKAKIIRNTNTEVSDYQSNDISMKVVVRIQDKLTVAGKIDKKEFDSIRSEIIKANTKDKTLSDKHTAELLEKLKIAATRQMDDVTKEKYNQAKKYLAAQMGSDDPITERFTGNKPGADAYYSAVSELMGKVLLGGDPESIARQIVKRTNPQFGNKYSANIPSDALNDIKELDKFSIQKQLEYKKKMSTPNIDKKKKEQTTKDYLNLLKSIKSQRDILQNQKDIEKEARGQKKVSK